MTAVRRQAAPGILALLLASPAVAQAPAETPGALVLEAEARRRLPSTVSDAQVTVEIRGRDLRSTATALAQRAQGVIGFLQAQGAERLRTEASDFEPDVQLVRNGPDRIVGYAGRSLISFRTTPERLPFLLSGSLENGASSMRQSGSTPRETELQVAREELAAEATRLAVGQARAIAAAGGARLGPIRRLELNPREATDAPPADAQLASPRLVRAIPPLASAAGEQEVVVRVRVTFRLLPGE